MRNTKKITTRRALDVIKFTDCSHKQISSTISPKGSNPIISGHCKLKNLYLVSLHDRSEAVNKKLKLKLSIPNKVKALMQKKKLLLNIKSESHSKQTSLNTSIDNLFKERKGSIGTIQNNKQTNVLYILINI